MAITNVNMCLFVQLMYLVEVIVFSFFSEMAAKVMIELLGTYTEDNASQARDDAHK